MGAHVTSLYVHGPLLSGDNDLTVDLGNNLLIEPGDVLITVLMGDLSVLNPGPGPAFTRYNYYGDGSWYNYKDSGGHTALWYRVADGTETTHDFPVRDHAGLTLNLDGYVGQFRGVEVNYTDYDNLTFGGISTQTLDVECTSSDMTYASYYATDGDPLIVFYGTGGQHYSGDDIPGGFTFHHMFGGDDGSPLTLEMANTSTFVITKLGLNTTVVLPADTLEQPYKARRLSAHALPYYLDKRIIKDVADDADWESPW